MFSKKRSEGSVTEISKRVRRKKVGDETPNPLPGSASGDESISSTDNELDAITAKPFPSDRTAPQRRKNLTDQELWDLKLAGGVEGGMRAGSAVGKGSANPRSKP